MRRSLLAFAAALLLAAPVRAQEASPAALDAARRHVAARAQGLGATAADVADMAVTASHADPGAGLSYVYLRQRLDGVEVAGSEVTVAVQADGAVRHAAGTLVARLDRAGRRAPALGAEGAVRAAAGYVGAALPATLGATAPRGADRLTTFTTPPEALAPLTARLVYHATPTTAPVLAWEVGPLETGGAEPHAWMVRVDAGTGAELWRADLTAFDPMPVPEGADADAAPVSLAPLRASAKAEGPLAVRLPDQYRVYPPPAEGPNETTSVLIANPADALASPFGWHDTNGAAGAEYTITRGNNAHAYLDTNADNLPDTGADVDGGATLSFDFPADLTQHPNTYRPAAVTNLFYWSNLLHDLLYQYGFTEAAGNFQVNNYGRGGAANDDLRSEGQDGAGTNNANFSTPVDGQRPRMQMYLYTLTNPFRDGDLSNMTLAHEYSHGLTNRLTGGPAVSGCLSNAEQMGEGWGDWLAAMLTMVDTDTRATHRPYGVYPRGLSPTGPGLRLAALNTDFAVNPYTYGRTRTMTAVHEVGFVWSTVLWEVAWEMIDAYGFSPDTYDAGGTAGNQMMIRLMVQGLKLQPCSPGFVTGRDAILAADALLYPDPANPGRGLHYVPLWTGFARRGLGVSASQGASTTNTDNTEAFNLPFAPPAAALPVAAVSAALAEDAATTRTLVVQNTAVAGSANLSYVVSAVAAPLPLAPEEETPAGPPVSGTLEVIGAPAEDATPGPAWLTATPASGSVAPGESDTLTVTLDADGLAAGLYTAALRVVTTDPARPTITVPVALQVGGAALADGPGWRMLAAPVAGLTVDSLAAQNLVQGVPGYYPATTPPTLLTYSGTGWIPSAGAGTTVEPGEGVLWYFFDQTFDPGGPSQSYALPRPLLAPAALSEPEGDVAVPLHALGSGINLVGNPYLTSLDVAGLGAWATGGTLAGAVAQVWDPAAATYRLSTLTGDAVASWQGFFVENRTDGTGATALTVPATARTTGAPFFGRPEAADATAEGDAARGGADTRLVAFELAGEANDAPLMDAAVALTLRSDAVEGTDAWDARKLAPLAPAYAVLAIEGSDDGSPVLRAQESRPYAPADPFEVTLAFGAVGTDTTFTLRWPQLVNVAGWALELVDLETGTVVNLQTQTSYTFNAQPTGPATSGIGPGDPARALATTPRFALRVDADGTTAAAAAPAALTTALAPPAPNPVAGTGTVRFSVAEAGPVALELYDALGRRVAVLLEGQVEAGPHTARLDASALAAGPYVVRLRAGTFTQTQRLTVAR